METKRIVTGLIAAAVFAGLVACPALARRYDTMMVGPDRWIDIDYLDVQCEKAEEVVFHEGKNTKPQKIALNEGPEEEPGITTYDGQLEPNTVTLIYFPGEHPEHPNDINIDELEPNLATLFHQRQEHPEHPNSIDYEEDIDPNLMLIWQQSEHPEHPEHPNSIYYQEDIDPNNLLIYIDNEHPEEPNQLNNEEEIDPNDIDRIILDEGTAYIKREKAKIAKSS